MAACKACNEIPPVTAEGYITKGSYSTIGGLNTYVTGSRTSTKAVVHIMDIFGLASQTLQGADILAAALGALVFVPDFFKGEPAKGEWFGPGEENEKKKNEFMSKLPATFQTGHQELAAVVEDGKTKFPQVDGWATLGLCWGGKVIAMSSGPGTPFKVSGQVHPVGLAKADAETITIPHVVLASKDEDQVGVKDYAEVFSQPGKVGEIDTFPTMHHGWMGARADLTNADNLKEYGNGYNQVVKFFAKYL